MKKFLFVLLSCLLLAGCSGKGEPKPEDSTLKLLKTAFDTELCGSLNDSKTAYAVVVERQPKEALDDLLACLNTLEEMELKEEYRNNVTAICITYLDMPSYSVYVVRDKYGDHFDAKINFK